MRRFKKLAVCLCVAIVGSTIITAPVSAKRNSSKHFKETKDSYTEPETILDFQYTSSHGNVYYQESRVTNIGKKYKDPTISKYAEENIAKGYYVGDLKTLNKYGLGCCLNISDDRVFNNGIAIYDDGDYYDETSFVTFVCKCSNKDYKELKEYYSDEIIEQKGKYEFVTKESKGEWTFTYNPETDILIVNTVFDWL